MTKFVQGWRKLSLLAILLTLSFSLAACDSSSATPTAVAATTTVPPMATTSGATSSGKKLKVVATTTQLQDMAKNALGDNVELIGILTADADPHEYEPTADDVRKLADADIILRNGVELEKWMDKLIASSGSKASSVDCSRGIKLRAAGPDEPSGNPHVWFNPQNAKLMVDNIANAVSARDAAGAAAIKASAEAYKAKIEALDQYIQQQWNSKISNPADRKLVTNHDAFGYYTDRYKLTFVGSIIPSIDTNYQPSAQELAALVDKIKSSGVKAIFLESSINPQVSQQIAKDAGVKVVDGALYGDTLGPADSPGGTYLGMMRYDTDLMIAGMTGQEMPATATPTATR